MLSDPKIDPERLKQWKANILPVPTAERLKGKGSPPSSCSHKRITDLIEERGWKPLPPHLREDRIPAVILMQNTTAMASPPETPTDTEHEKA